MNGPGDIMAQVRIDFKVGTKRWLENGRNLPDDGLEMPPVYNIPSNLSQRDTLVHVKGISLQWSILLFLPLRKPLHFLEVSHAYGGQLPLPLRWPL